MLEIIGIAYFMFGSFILGIASQMPELRDFYKIYPYLAVIFIFSLIPLYPLYLFVGWLLKTVEL